jgi:arginine utilization protein RocB
MSKKLNIPAIDLDMDVHKIMKRIHVSYVLNILPAFAEKATFKILQEE